MTEDVSPRWGERERGKHTRHKEGAMVRRKKTDSAFHQNLETRMYFYFGNPQL